MTTNQTLVQMLQMSSWQLERTVSGFDADQWFHIPAEGVASAAWIVGHATLIDRRVLKNWICRPCLRCQRTGPPFSKRALKTERRTMTIPEGQS